MDPALDRLLRSQPALWRGRDRYHDVDSIPTGFTALDAALPARGWCVGGVTELLTDRSGIGETSLLLPGLKRLTDDDQWVAFINPPHVPYAPALCNAGVRPDRLLIIDSRNDEDTLWAAEQVLRAGLFAAVVAWVHRTSARSQRRLQLAAESSRSWATVYRPLSVRQAQSPVSLRLTLERNDSGLLLDLIKVRGGRPATLSIDPAEFDVHQGVEWPVVTALSSIDVHRARRA